LKTRELGTCDRVVRRVFRALLWALTLSGCFIAAAPAGDRLVGDQLAIDLGALGKVAGKDDRAVNLFVDIASTRLAEEVKLTDKRRVDLVGVPVVIGALRQNGAAPSVTAGIAGKYDLTLADHLSLRTSGQLSRTHAIDSDLLSASRAGGEATLQFEAGGTRLQLRPSLHAALQEDLLHAVDLGLEARLRQELATGLALSAAAGRAWHDAIQFDVDDRETAFGRLGLKFDFPHPDFPALAFLAGGDLELAYQVDSRAGMLASQYRIAHGPVLLAHLAAAGGWRITGRYALTATERGDDDSDAESRRHDARHRLSLESDWDLGSSTGADWHMKADYGFERTLTDDPVQAPALHTAMVSFALNF
jgi:hypothetical protein